MPFNQLLLPLLGGFIFVSNWRRTKYFMKRADNTRLLFYSAAAGIVFLLISVILEALLSFRLSVITVMWSSYVPIADSGKPFIAFLLAATSWAPLNLFWQTSKEIDRAVEKMGTTLEKMLHRAMKELQLVMVFVKSGELYVGYVIYNFNPILPNDSLRLIPVISGYRDAATKEVSFTAFYPSTEEDNESEILKLADLALALPIAEVTSVHRFDADAYPKSFKA